MKSLRKEHEVLKYSGLSCIISQAFLHRLQGLLSRVRQASMLSKRPSIYIWPTSKDLFSGFKSLNDLRYV